MIAEHLKNQDHIIGLRPVRGSSRRPSTAANQQVTFSYFTLVHRPPPNRYRRLIFTTFMITSFLRSATVSYSSTGASRRSPRSSPLSGYRRFFGAALAACTAGTSSPGSGFPPRSCGPTNLPCRLCRRGGSQQPPQKLLFEWLLSLLFQRSCFYFCPHDLRGGWEVGCRFTVQQATLPWLETGSHGRTRPGGSRP